MRPKLFFAVCALLFALQLSAQSQIQCTIKGEVVNRQDTRPLILIKADDDPRRAESIIHIPVHSGKFEYVLNCDHIEMYTIWFPEDDEAGMGCGNLFFSEQTTVTLVLHPRSVDEDACQKNFIGIKGGPLTTEYHTAQEMMWEVLTPLFEASYSERNQLIKEGKYYTPEYANIYEKLYTTSIEERGQLWDELNKLTKAGKELAPEGIAWKKENDAIVDKWQEMRLQYAKENPTLVGYYILKEAASAASDYSLDVAPMTEIFNTIYVPKFPNHPLTEDIRLLLNSIKTIQVGGRYIDFDAPDLEGNNHKLSEVIQGKIAIINLWASWCGPCRRKGIALIPIYEKYKDKGFTVVGVAREKNANHMKTAVERDGYPWLNLLVLPDRAQIWKKYGGSFIILLVDENGIILAVNPDVEEVETILKQRLK